MNTNKFIKRGLRADKKGKDYIIVSEKELNELFNVSQFYHTGTYGFSNDKQWLEINNWFSTLLFKMFKIKICRLGYLPEQIFSGEVGKIIGKRVIVKY